jgi:hypothetical protein
LPSLVSTENNGIKASATHQFMQFLVVFPSCCVQLNPRQKIAHVIALKKDAKNVSDDAIT